ncbi:futalosine hydrolase [Desulfobaculum xiamenense]|uniref:Futalosine hydrolase n=1 Tax=Desulfobaculum xiamenense TaxID=995050 RepID=A0A846QS13_9BACT|nr:futalosine hydrolase [Desulfobaculum xiamenense]NJB68215.1 futalosine hydrolase [Desulfobaculum xiamenense]
MLALVFATARECSAALPQLHPVPEQGGWLRSAVCGRDAFVLVTGLSPINAGLHLGRLVASQSGIDGVLNLGVAGTLDDAALPLGAVCAANAELWPEYGLNGPNGTDPQGIGFALHDGPAGRVFDRIDLDPAHAARAMGLTLPAHWARAGMLTVSGVTGTPQRLSILRERYPDARTEGMEGFALALACAQLGLPFLEIRTVSNRVGSRAAEDWNLPQALERLAEVATTLLGGASPAGTDEPIP